jgi:Ca2+/Na+ antiporter
MKKEEIYKIAIETRNMEISLFWQRSNYFMVLNTAIAVGFFSLKNESYAPILAAVGLVVAIIWYLVNIGSKFWQSRWEHRLHLIEKEIEKKEKVKINLFSANWETIQSDVKGSFENSRHKNWRKFLDRQVMKKPSVSLQMTVLSLLFVLFWVSALVVSIVCLVLKIVCWLAWLLKIASARNFGNSRDRDAFSMGRKAVVKKIDLSLHLYFFLFRKSILEAEWCFRKILGLIDNAKINT